MQSAKPTRTKTSSIIAAITVVAAIVLLGVIFTRSTSAQTYASPVSPNVEALTPTPTTCPPVWIVSPGQNVGNGANILKDVTAISPNDVWAVGYYDLGNTVYRTMAQHWDGTQWTIVPTANPGYSNLMSGVSAIASNDVWAVGYYNLSPTTGGYHLLTLHWDGTQWNTIPNPDPGFNYTNLLHAVDAVATDNVWTVGFYRHFSPLDLRMHWEGSEWIVSNEPQTPIASLTAVDARTATDVWAAGSTNSDPIIEHYDGTAWTLIPEPALANPASMSGIVGTAANDAWAVGTEVIGGINHSLVERWNSTAWTVVTVPDVGALFGIDASSPTDVWAVGEGSFLHWDGASWSSVPAPSSGRLFGVDVIASDNIWTVGTHNVGGVNRTLIERYIQLCGTATPTPTVTGTSQPTSTFTSTPTPSNTPQTATSTPTNPTPGTPTSTQVTTGTPQQSTSTSTPTATNQTGTTTPLSTNTSTGTPTATPAQPTNTAVLTPTATVCSISFTDVEPASTFYSYIHCLACRGIVQGYPDGTYRPSDSVTRGQASKIISNSAGWSDTIPPNRQTFNDVQPNSTFWLYIERMYIHEAVQGYPCGGPGEPCPGLYFRPGSTITRGQIAKIASISAGYNDIIPPQQQTFSDVLPNSSFWLYVERVALHNIVNGYDDGTYRPQNTVTRGQIAKIATNAFFPDCDTP